MNVDGGQDFLKSIEFSIGIGWFTDNAELCQRHVSGVRRQAKVHVRIPRWIIPWLCEQGIISGERPGRVVGVVSKVRLPEQHNASVYERSRPEVLLKPNITSYTLRVSYAKFFTWWHKLGMSQKAQLLFENNITLIACSL